MNKAEITRIIESTLTSGNKMPGLFDLPKIMGIKMQLQSCQSVADVLAIIDEHRDLISKAFSLNEGAIDLAVDKIKSLEGK